MAKTPRYTTFAPGELEARLRELAPEASVFGVTWSEGQIRRGTTLLKEHRFAVSLPDGTEASCRYERLGSQYHRFEYTHHDGTTLPRQNLFERLANEARAIEEKGQELKEACFRDAIEYERRDYFARASEPSDGSRKKRPECYRIKAKTAKELGGHYCVCQVYNRSLYPRTVAYRSLERANTVWKELELPNMIVACCNRLDRCWEVPRWNPLYANTELREVARMLSPERWGRKEERQNESVSGTQP